MYVCCVSVCLGKSQILLLKVSDIANIEVIKDIKGSITHDVALRGNNHPQVCQSIDHVTSFSH